MRSCVCVSSAVAVWPVLSLPSSNLCLPLYPLLSQDPLKHPGFPSGMFHLSLLPSWFVPLPLAFSPTSCLPSLVVGCRQV
ncbi:hypothetical protein GQ42DRAFT_161207, partial [Ramicandelaber brevisporus]